MQRVKGLTWQNAESFQLLWLILVVAEGGQYEDCVGSSDSDSGRMGPRRVSQSSEASYGSPPVDPLVVNFEEGMRLY
jgi:hypothetical protein